MSARVSGIDECPTVELAGIVDMSCVCASWLLELVDCPTRTPSEDATEVTNDPAGFTETTLCAPRVLLLTTMKLSDESGAVAERSTSARFGA